MFRHLILLDNDLALPCCLVVDETNPGLRKERVEKRLELVYREDRKYEGHVASTWGGGNYDPCGRCLRNLPLLHDERR